jgi:hypothetical protein
MLVEVLTCWCRSRCRCSRVGVGGGILHSCCPGVLSSTLAPSCPALCCPGVCASYSQSLPTCGSSPGLTLPQSVVAAAYYSCTNGNNVRARGAWCVVRGAWCVVRGAWCVVRGAWCVVRGAYRPSISLSLAAPLRCNAAWWLAGTFHLVWTGARLLHRYFRWGWHLKQRPAHLRLLR